MEPNLYSMHKGQVFIGCIVFIVICIVVFTVDYSFSYDTFESSALTSASVIMSFPMYILLSVLPDVLSGVIVSVSECSSLLTKLNAGFFVIYIISFPVAYEHLHDVDEKWQLFMPFILATALGVLWQAMKGYAPIEVNRYFKDAPSIGEVWANACYTYYVEVFKDFVDRLKRFEKNQRQIDDTFTIKLKKMIILIPLSCDAEGDLEKHPNMEYVDILEIHKDARGGNVNRQYKNPVYKITSTHRGQSSHMYIAIEEPNTLIALKKLQKSVPEEIWEFQRDEFISNLRYRLSGQTCCEILEYDDLQKGHTTPLNEFLFEEVEKLLITDGSSSGILVPSSRTYEMQ